MAFKFDSNGLFALYGLHILRKYAEGIKEAFYFIDRNG
jgi:hypothetical protein